MSNRIGMSVNVHLNRTNLTPRITRHFHEGTTIPYFRVTLECDVIDSPTVTLYLTPEQVTQLSSALNEAFNDNVLGGN